MAAYELNRNASSLSITMNGDFTSVLVPELKSALQSEIDGGAAAVVFDLSRTLIVDSTAIGFLIATYNTLSKKQGTLRITGASPDIVRLFQSMRLDQRLGVSAK